MSCVARAGELMKATNFLGEPAEKALVGIDALHRKPRFPEEFPVPIWCVATIKVERLLVQE
jgi:hypothetical protein